MLHCFLCNFFCHFLSFSGNEIWGTPFSWNARIRLAVVLAPHPRHGTIRCVTWQTTRCWQNYQLLRQLRQNEIFQTSALAWLMNSELTCRHCSLNVWDMGSCSGTEIFYEQNTNNVTDMFPPRHLNWSIAAIPSGLMHFPERAATNKRIHQHKASWFQPL